VTEWHLLIQDDEGSAIAVPLNTDKLSLGRLEDNLVRLTQRNISRQHAVLIKNEDNFSFQDLDSSNGSFLNGQKIEDIVSLNNGDTLQMGDYVLQLYQGDIKKLHESGGNNLDLKTNPGINLAVLSDLSMEMFGQLASDVSSSFPAKQLFSWAGLNETPPDSVIVHGAQNQLLLSDDTGPLLSPILPTKTIELQTKYLFDTVQTTETVIDASSSTDTAEAQSSTQILDATQDSLYRPSAAALEKDPEVTKPTQPAVPKMHALPRVIIINTELAGKVFPILDENITMGRIPQTDFSIRHKSVSRRHARIYQQKDLYFVEDLESVNGIVVNGINESPQELIDDDIIELGRVKLRFCQAGNPFTLSTAEIQQAHADCDDNMSISTVNPSADPNFLHDNNETIIHTDKRNKVFFWPYVYLASSSDLAPQGSSII
jgi:pSer/pThr/pTyr-binding forkhead associated (FHA) protein